MGALAAACQPDGNHTATCASGKCEVIGQTEVCTECKAGGVPIDGFCRPASSPQATAAGCTGDASAGVCKACSGGFFLFMGGCYNTRAAPGSGVCREAQGGAYDSMQGAERVRKATSADTSTKCETSSCNVQIGDKLYCSKCNEPTTHAPVDGVCKAISNDDASGCKLKSPTADGTCTQCGANYFLHKGGCYKFGGEVGKLRCKDTVDSSGTAGVCSSCSAENGFFANLAPAATKQSCIACNETADINGLTGVAGCTACTNTGPAGQASPTPATCTKCEGTTLKYLKIVDGLTACVAESDCDKGGQKKFFTVDNAGNGGRCVSCGDAQGAADAAGGIWKGVAGCAKCTKPTSAGAATCTECSTDYLKTETSGTSCVASNACTGGFFPTTDTADSKKKCLACGTADKGGIADCGECSLLTAASRSSTVLSKCTKCGNNKYLKSDGSGCGESSGCASGTEFAKEDTEKGNKCVSCGDATSGVPNCAKCTAPSTAGQKPTCSECASGYKLEGDTCVRTGGNLSTGAIAGISVAAVVVVGGLVGFLCWWFICRGKA